MNLCVIAHTSSGNALGRAFSHWLAAQSLGWSVTVLVPDATVIWSPLQHDAAFVASVTSEIGAAVRSADVLLAVKTQPRSFGRALGLRRQTGLPLILDVDDPDWEASYGENLRSRASTLVRRSVRGRPPIRAYGLRWAASRARVVTVSNPCLHRWYPGATVLPHARIAREAGAPHVNNGSLAIAFVGTVRRHKGLSTLREAVQRVEGSTLTVTADAPSDVLPRERWVGQTSFSGGLDLVDQADVVALVSSPTVYGRGQLPAKLIDAMVAGRAIVASDLPPMRWALGKAGVIVDADDTSALVTALQSLRAPELRRELGDRARQRAIDMFSVEVVAARLSEIVEGAMRA